MLLLDTHAFIWLASDQSQMPQVALETICGNAGQLFLSGISGLEIALAVKRGRLELPIDPASFVQRGLAQHGIEEIPVTAALGCRAAQLPDVHNDPFDRIIVATAHAHGLDVLSKDPLIAKYPRLRVIWSGQTGHTRSTERS